MGNVVFLHVSRPDVVRDINLCVSLDLGKSSYLKATHEPLFGGGILKSNGEAWLHQRKIIAPEFFLDKVKVRGHEPNNSHQHKIVYHWILLVVHIGLIQSYAVQSYANWPI